MTKKAFNVTEEASRCLLCVEAPCTQAAPKGSDPARFVRAVRFNNDKVGLQAILNCDDSTLLSIQEACIHYDRPIRIARMAETLRKKYESEPSDLVDIDLAIDFCGIRCENPFFLSSSVIASNYEMCAKALSLGWAGLVFKTIGIFLPEEISPRFSAIGKEGTPFIGFRNLEQISDKPLKENLAILKRLKQDFPDKVIVASIMGNSEKEWTELARLVTEAGVDMIECNFSCPHMSGDGLGSDVGQNPELVRRYTQCTREGTSLPILAKMTPNIGNMELPALAANEGGADGIAAINTIKSLTGIQLQTFSAPPAVHGKSAISGYSGKAIKPIALRFINDLACHPTLSGIPLSGMGGVETWQDGLEFILLGCSNVQVTTSVMQYGYRIIDDLTSGLQAFMAEQGFSHLFELVGAARSNIIHADELDRQSIVYPIIDRDLCLGCGRCYVSCLDAGHQALSFGKDRVVHLNAKKCKGCHLCLLVCPVGAIHPGKRVTKPMPKE